MAAILGMLAGYAANKIMSSWDDSRQLSQQGKLTQQQVAAQKDLIDYNRESQLAMWKNTNFGAQMAELKEAGLSPALMYGGSGPGGATTGGGAPSAQGGQAANAAQTMQNTLQLGMMKANIEAMESQADKNQADAALAAVEAKKKAGADTDLAQADAGLKLSQKELNEVNTGIAMIQKDIAGRTSNQAVDIINKQMGILTEELKTKAAEAKMAPQMQQALVAKAQNEASLLAIKKLAEEENIQLTEAQTQSVLTGIQQRWQELGVQKGKAGAEHTDRVAAMRNELVKAGIYVTGQLADNLIKLFTKIPQTDTKGTRTIKYDEQGEYAGHTETSKY